MTEPDVKACRTCGAPVVWARTVNGKLMPLDHPPERRFVLDVVRAGAARELRCASVETYQSHFATCPQAAAHRKSG